MYCRYLVKIGTVHVLTKSLSYFKVYDQVLTQIYKFCGPSFNFEFVRDVLIALENIGESPSLPPLLCFPKKALTDTLLSLIVNVGELEAEEKKKLNQYALSFDMGCVDALRNILQAIKQSPPEEVEAWRQKARRPGENSIEVRPLLSCYLGPLKFIDCFVVG